MDRSVINKFHVFEWWFIALLMIPIIIPVVTYSTIEKYFKLEKNDRI